MKTKLVNTSRISISNFTFDSKTNTISFFSTKTNKCWSRTFSETGFNIWSSFGDTSDLSTRELNSLKKLCKNGN